jgi:hypothetical protein
MAAASSWLAEMNTTEEAFVVNAVVAMQTKNGDSDH